MRLTERELFRHTCMCTRRQSRHSTRLVCIRHCQCHAPYQALREHRFHELSARWKKCRTAVPYSTGLQATRLWQSGHQESVSGFNVHVAAVLTESLLSSTTLRMSSVRRVSSPSRGTNAIIALSICSVLRTLSCSLGWE